MLLYVIDKYTHESNLKEEGLALAHSFRRSVMAWLCGLGQEHHGSRSGAELLQLRVAGSRERMEAGN